MTEHKLICLLQLLRSPAYGLIFQDIILSRIFDKRRYPPELQPFANAIFSIFNNEYNLERMRDVSAHIIQKCYQQTALIKDCEYQCSECALYYSVYMSRCRTLYCEGELRHADIDFTSVILDLNIQLREDVQRKTTTH